VADQAERFVPQTAEQLIVCYTELSFLLRVGPHDLSAIELSAVLPPRGPVNTYQNRVRGHVIKTLNQHGFTFNGKRLC
jgi:hypothetical protein